MSSEDETQDIRLTQKAFYLLSHLTGVHSDFLYSIEYIEAKGL